MMQFKVREAGCYKGWACIDITPIDESLFIPLLKHLMKQYKFSKPRVTDRITGYFADFKILGVQATLDIDTYDFFIAIDDVAIRNQVCEDLITAGF